jgi:hypothetical protein
MPPFQRLNLMEREEWSQRDQQWTAAAIFPQGRSVQSALATHQARAGDVQRPTAQSLTRICLSPTVALEFSMHPVPFNSEKRSSFLCRLDKGDHRFDSLSPESGPRAPNPPPEL